MTQTKQKTIDSGHLIDDINQHFRVFAGPGAGKTHWLVNHIKQVLGKSSRLYSGARIACISYTTVAAEEIVKKIDGNSDQVEISTIHSFLYANIVKPYIHLVTRGDGTPIVSGLHGVEEHHATPGKIRSLKRKVLTDNMSLALAAVEDLTWHMDGQGTLHLEFRHPYKWLGKFPLGKKSFSFPKDDSIKYKELYWDEGRIHHEDVLYFAYKILSENPGLIKFLSARYPFVFVDEFQYTTPIQTWIIHRLAEHGSTIGVIGDIGQAIYAFADASVEDFSKFELPGQLDFVIDGNRRSTKPIVDFLNVIRGQSLVQTCVRNEPVYPVTVLVGDMHSNISKAKSWLPEETPLHVLARTRGMVSKIIAVSVETKENVWNQLRDYDSDKEVFLRRIITSMESAKIMRFNSAIDEIQKVFRVRNGELRKPLSGNELSDWAKRSVSLSLLKYLMTSFEQMKTLPAGDFYNKLQEFLTESHGIKMTKALPRGKFKPYADQFTYGHLVTSINLSTNEIREIRTIHQAKGAEFDAVLVCLQSPDELITLLDSDIEDKSAEELRIRYVGLSRARDYLFVSVPELSLEAQARFEVIGLNVYRVN